MSRKRILAIDDEQKLRKLYEDFLTDAGYEVTTLGDGFTGVVETANADFDLVILDIMMPGMDGIEALKNLRETHPTLPVLIVSAYVENLDVMQILEYGNVKFLGKPFDLLDLKDNVSTLIAGLPEENTDS